MTETRIVLSRRGFDAFVASLESPPAPNEKLIRLMAYDTNMIGLPDPDGGSQV